MLFSVSLFTKVIVEELQYFIFRETLENIGNRSVASLDKLHIL